MKNQWTAKILCTIAMIGILSLPVMGKIYAQENKEITSGSQLEAIINGVAKRYDVSSFSAAFYQTSTLKVMEITDTGNGRIVVKRPWKMRWEYETPEKQVYVTNGEEMWIYRPGENQVQVGKASSFFTGIVRAVFLLDMKQIRSYFDIRLVLQEDSKYHILRLVNKEEIADVAEIYLTVSKKSFIVEEIVKYNSMGDNLTYKFSGFIFNKIYPDTLFTLKIPENADVQYLDE